MQSWKHLHYKNENIEIRCLNNTQKTSKQTNKQKRFLKVKNRLLELEDDFIGLKDKELETIKEIEELFSKPIIGSI